MVVPPKYPKMIIFSRKTHGCWVPAFKEPPCIVGRYEILKFISARGAWPPQTVFGRVPFKQATQVLRSAIKQPWVDIHPWLGLPLPFETHEYAWVFLHPKALRSFVEGLQEMAILGDFFFKSRERRFFSSHIIGPSSMVCLSKGDLSTVLG